jgi:hypothetical protein
MANTILEHNVETGEVIERPMNKSELDQRKKDIAANEVANAAKAKAEADKAALLARLGLTEDELKTILG